MGQEGVPRPHTLLTSVDNSGLKIDLKSIIESKTLPIIDSEFLDRFRTLSRTFTLEAVLLRQPVAFNSEIPWSLSSLSTDELLMVHHAG